MPHVSVHYKVYLPAGHHRQPRNASATLEPNPSSEVDVTDPGNISPLYLPQLSYVAGGQTMTSELLFWSVTDGANGQTYPAGPLTQPVGDNPLTITAWYYPIGGVGTGPTSIIVDAFSAVRGSFIDDTFVTVTSDPALTSSANVVGVVPTSRPETLQAAASVSSTSEPFSRWQSFGAGTASGNLLNVPVGASGVAIAFYEATAGIPLPRLPKGDYGIVGTIIGGPAVDGDGGIIVNGVFHHIDPWGPLLVALIDASLIVGYSSKLTGTYSAQARHLATSAVLQTIREITPVIEKGLQQK